MMAQLVYFKEWLTTLYKRHIEIILPILKLLFAFFCTEYVSENVLL